MCEQDATEPTRGTFTFSGGDTVVQLAQKNGQVVRGQRYCIIRQWYDS